MIRAFFVEFVFPCLLFLFVRMILRNMFASMQRTIGGETVHFCSEQCSRRYAAR